MERILIAAAIGLVMALGLFWRAWYESRRGRFYYTREQAARRARNFGLFAVLPLMTIVVALAIHWWNNRDQSEPMPTPTHPVARTMASVLPTPTPSLLPATPVASPSPTATPTGAAVSSPVELPPTPSPTAGGALDLSLPTAFQTPLPDRAITPSPDARFGPITLAAGIDDNKQPVDAGTVFPVGTERIYAFFEFENMVRNTPWTQAWYWNGREVGSEIILWQYNTQGSSWVFFGPQGGYEAGVWEVRLYIGQILQARASFETR
jgi:hypothetical protein